MSDLLVVSASPHIRSNESITKIMGDVIIALMPATLFGIYNFGLKALLIILLSIGSCVASEYFFQKITNRKSTIGDLSAILTGLLLALNLPHSVPWWIPVLGGVVAIIIVKQLFGGLGQNFMNPALGARAFLLISFAGLMTTWKLDGMTTATPLAFLGGFEVVGEMPSLLETFIGTIGGCIGETSALALLIGGIYLLVRKVITWQIPVFYILTVILMTILFGGQGFDIEFIGYQIFSGGLIIGAFFMATDYSSSPTSSKGQIIMGIGCGVLTMVIRLFGGYPEGVSFAIIIMNLFVPLIDKYMIPKAFGEVAE